MEFSPFASPSQNSSRSSTRRGSSQRLEDTSALCLVSHRYTRPDTSEFEGLHLPLQSFDIFILPPSASLSKITYYSSSANLVFSWKKDITCSSSASLSSSNVWRPQRLERSLKLRVLLLRIYLLLLQFSSELANSPTLTHGSDQPRDQQVRQPPASS